MSGTIIVDNDFAKETCKFGEGIHQCRYLCSGLSFYSCQKQKPSGSVINNEIKKFLETESKEEAENIGLPCGDNCNGYGYVRKSR